MQAQPFVLQSLVTVPTIWDSPTGIVAQLADSTVHPSIQSDLQVLGLIRLLLGSYRGPVPTTSAVGGLYRHRFVQSTKLDTIDFSLLVGKPEQTHVSRRHWQKAASRLVLFSLARPNLSIERKDSFSNLSLVILQVLSSLLRFLRDLRHTERPELLS